MSEATAATLLDQARAAAGHGDWREAYQRLVDADLVEPLGGADLMLLAQTAYAAGDFDRTIEAWERAYAEGLKAGQRVQAAGAAVRLAMHLLFDTALLAPVRGWLARAERLLEGEDDSPVHAWLAVVRNYERLLSGDFARARGWARRAVDLGERLEPAAAAIGRVAVARSLIFEGEVAEGLRLLDEAGVAAVSGEIDPLSTGVVYCELICALQAVAQYDLAEEWTTAMERWRQGKPVGSLHGRCRVHRAEILRLRGACADADAEARRACDELRPYLRRELGWPLTELGRIRWRLGDLDGAEEAFLAAHQAGWDPQPGLALVHLARGDVQGAARSIREALEDPAGVPSKELPPNTDLRRAPLLDAQVEIEIAAGDLDRARASAAELARIAAVFRSRALMAGAALAEGRVRLAEGDAAAARRAFETAASEWTAIGAPYEAALAREGLAGACRAEGHVGRAELELAAAHAAFGRIGATRDAARTEAAGRAVEPDRNALPMAGPARETASAEHNRGECLFQREGDYWSIVFAGRTARLRDAKGLGYLARLLASPGQELHVLALVARPPRDPGGNDRDRASDRAGALAGDAGELLDARAKAAYRRRLSEIDADLDEARAMADAARVAQATAEREFLVRELARAVGLGGRDRRAGAASERARSAVTRAVRQALARIRACHPALGEHFDRTIRTGTYCAYLPDPRVPPRWEL